MDKKDLFFITLVVVGFLDWLTTEVGVLFYGANELNPFLSGLTNSMVLFSAVKLSAVVFTGLAFYKAAHIASANPSLGLTKRFLDGGYFLTFLALAVVVSNNMIAVLSL
jgi:hypothetical protein